MAPLIESIGPRRARGGGGGLVYHWGVEVLDLASEYSIPVA
jgi:hypothetical protein